MTEPLISPRGFELNRFAVAYTNRAGVVRGSTYFGTEQERAEWLLDKSLEGDFVVLSIYEKASI